MLGFPRGNGNLFNMAITSARAPMFAGPNFATVAHPERVSEWERVLYRALVSAGLKPIAQFSVEQYDLDFAVVEGDRKRRRPPRRRRPP